MLVKKIIFSRFVLAESAENPFGINLLSQLQTPVIHPGPDRQIILYYYIHPTVKSLHILEYQLPETGRA
jgi:hypothetical protein